jgi:putative transcriptional regulator
MNQLEAGILLVSDPFLKDPNFLRAVILICDYNEEGSFGFVLNNQYDKNLNELIEDINHIHFPVFCGGPVQMETLHFLHTKPKLIDGGVEIIDGIYWGGNFKQVLHLIQTNQITPRDIRFYIGYSGWEAGQLEAEVEEKSWILHKSEKKFIFHLNTNMLWKDVLKDMGGDYKIMVNFPIDPQLN